MTENALRPMLHVVYGGEGHDVPLDELDIGDASTDDQIKQAVASFFEFPVDKLRFYVIDREETGNVTVRPQATFG